MNEGGTIHTETELTKVREMLASHAPYVKPARSELVASARLDDREVLVKAVMAKAEEEARRHETFLKQEANAAKPKKTRSRRSFKG